LTDRLSLYNGALRECQERRLASLAENREPRRLLDDVWNAGDGILRFVLQAKQWNFARRTVELAADTAVEPAFGYTFAFAQPDDFLRTCRLCSDERLIVPLLDYQVEAGYWYADIEPIYLTYVSNDTDYGGDYAKWPPNFVLWVETHMASLIAGRLTGSDSKRNDLLKLAEMRLKKAASTDAMEGPTEFPPEGSWVRSRRGGSGLRRRDDRGSRSRLIG
jgi:hypothetical protein